MERPVAPRHPTRRLAALVLAVLQLAATGLVPVADGSSWKEIAASSLHVESQGSPGCAPAHDHLFCQLCRTTSLGAVPGTVCVAPRALLSSTAAAAAWGADVLAGRTFRLVSPGPRAPPLA